MFCRQFAFPSVRLTVALLAFWLLASPQFGHAAQGRSYDVQIHSPKTGELIYFTVHEPDEVATDKKSPLLLIGAGFGGAREKNRGNVERYIKAGFGMISFDQRGFGDSEAPVSVMDPDKDGANLVEILDWAESHLNWLAYKDGKLRLGAVGESYGGGYQLALLAIDPKSRLQAIVPQITWHDLAYSLAPGGVPKTTYALLLSTMAETGSKTGFDPRISSMLAKGLLNNELETADRRELTYHSLKHACDGGRYGDRPARPLPKVDALLMQGMHDVLFNVNESYANYRCLSRAGGDVRFMTYQFGHVLPLSPDGLQAVPGIGEETRNCGRYSAAKAELAWLQAKLQDKPELLDGIPKLCISLDAKGDAVEPPAFPVGGVAASVKPTLVTPTALGALPVAYPLYVADADRVLAGMPQAVLNVEGVVGSLTEVGDPILFLALGRVSAQGLIEPIGDQVRPLKGWGKHSLDLNAVGWRMHKGEKLYLLVYGSHPQFPTSSSRFAMPAAVVSGVLGLPLRGVSGSVRAGVDRVAPAGAVAPVLVPKVELLPAPIAGVVNQVESGLMDGAAAAIHSVTNPVSDVAGPLIFGSVNKAINVVKGVFSVFK